MLVIKGLWVPREDGHIISSTVTNPKSHCFKSESADQIRRFLILCCSLLFTGGKPASLENRCLFQVNMLTEMAVIIIRSQFEKLF